MNAIESNCNCNFTYTMIDHGEFSCKPATFSAIYRQVSLRNLDGKYIRKDSIQLLSLLVFLSLIYRARITGSSETLSASAILAHIQDWLTNDGTFLYTYHARIRVRADPQCPLKIKSFSEQECGDGSKEEQPNTTFFLAPHRSPDEL